MLDDYLSFYERILEKFGKSSMDIKRKLVLWKKSLK